VSTPAVPAGGSADPYLVWSNKYGMWWKGDELGYVPDVVDVGRFGLERARNVCRAAAFGWDRAASPVPPAVMVRAADIPAVTSAAGLGQLLADVSAEAAQYDLMSRERTAARLVRAQKLRGAS
jgi:hypothetical protein